MNPTFFSTCGTRKCRCFHRFETARIATSSAFTRSSFAIFSVTAGKDTSAAVPSDSSASANRSSSNTRPVLIVLSIIRSFRGPVVSAARRASVIRYPLCLRFLVSAARIFRLLVPFEATGRLASLLLTAYTEFCRDSNRVPAGSLLSNFPGTLAAERACLPRQPGLTQVICSESFTP